MGDRGVEGGGKVKSPSSWLKIFETSGFSFVKTSKSLKSDIANSSGEEKKLAEKTILIIEKLSIYALLEIKNLVRRGRQKIETKN